MTEFESWEVLNALTSNLMQQQALFIGAFTAYVVAAHWVGRTLTTFQVFFISAVFTVLTLLGIRAQLWFMANINEVAQGMETLIGGGGEGSQWLPTGFVILRFILVLGALFYMWQVRHPKTE